MQREEEVSNFIFLLYHSLSGPFLNIGSLILPSPCPFSTSPHFHHLLLNHLSQTPGICDHTIRRTPPWQSSLAHSDVLRSEFLWYSVHTCSSHLYWKAPEEWTFLFLLPRVHGNPPEEWTLHVTYSALCFVCFSFKVAGTLSEGLDTFPILHSCYNQTFLSPFHPLVVSGGSVTILSSSCAVSHDCGDNSVH